MTDMYKPFCVAVAGDICMQHRMNEIDAEFSKTALEQMQPVLQRADLRLINLENAVIDGGDAINKSGPALKARPENLVFLQEGRFDCAIVANNHVGDYGEEGVYSTIEALDVIGIGHTGAGRNIDESYRPWFRDVNGSKLAVIAACENEFGIAEHDKAGTAGLDIYRLYHSIKNAKAEADFVLVIIHGGNEYNPVPSPRVVSLYRLLADFGADAVIGMHPHCIQGFEMYNNVPIAYSTGNFLFPYPGKSDPNSSWYYGYLPLITFRRGEPAEMELVPYRFSPDFTRIIPFDGEKKEIMLSYINEISEPLKDSRLLKRFFMGWCMISGVEYAGHVAYNPEYLDEAEFKTGHPMLTQRNLFTCEAHNELMTVLFKMITDGKLKTGRAMVDEIKRLQKMPV